MLPASTSKQATPNRKGRGFAFIAPTVRTSKTTGELVAYRWIKAPDLARLGREDTSGGRLAELVRQARGSRKATAGRVLFQQPATRGQLGDLVPPGGRHAALISFRRWLRNLGLPLPEAEVLLPARFRDRSSRPATPLHRRRRPGQAARRPHRYLPGDPEAENAADGTHAAPLSDRLGFLPIAELCAQVDKGRPRRFLLRGIWPVTTTASTPPR